MKLYRFRPLKGVERDIDGAKGSDFRRAKMILEKKKFWCSSFSELNDPMEGVFYGSQKDIHDVVIMKNRFKICSFCNMKAFRNPAMWGYYANGFKGFVIEIETDETSVKEKKGKIIEMDYNDKIPSLKDLGNVESIEKVLGIKSTAWEHEGERRFLIESDDKEHEIGKITKVYFGNPYGDVSNKKDIYEKSESLTHYEKMKESLKDFALDHGIDCFSVEIKDGKVAPGKKLEKEH